MAVAPGMDFESAGRAVMEFLHQRLGFDLWMMTRKDGNDWIVVQTHDNGYNVQPGTVYSWADSFCSRMVVGEGPRIAPRSQSVAVYADAAIGRQLKIGAYVGVPITGADGSLFGTLCAIHPTPQPEAVAHELPLVELLASVLGALLTSELKVSEALRHAEHAADAAETDAMTSLYNRRGWVRLLEAEDTRCHRYGHQACVVVVDLDGLKRVNDTLGHSEGDNLICRAAHTLRSAVRTSDIVARVGGDEFTVLGVECGPEASRTLRDRIRNALAGAMIPASVGLGMRFPANPDLAATWREADKIMYLEKATRGSRVDALGSPHSDVARGERSKAIF